MSLLDKGFKFLNIELLYNSKARISKFVTEVSNLVVKECKASMLIGDMDINGLMTHSQ